MSHLAGKIWGQTQLIFANGACEFHRIEVRAGMKCSMHKHEFKFNGFFVESGQLLIRVIKNDYDLVDETVLKAGQFTTVKPNEFHQFECIEDCVAFEIYYAHFDHGDIKRQDHGGTGRTFAAVISRMIVTAIDEKYFPGLVALNNSIKINSPETPLACIVHGSPELAEAVHNIGVRPLHEPCDMRRTRLPTSSEWPNKIPAMYSRLWIPEMFRGMDRTIWLDADTIVLDDLRPLYDMDLGDHPIASTVSASPQGQPRLVYTQVDGLPKEKGNFKGCTSGVIVFNHQAYEEKRILETCRGIMDTSTLNLKFVVQSVLNLALRGDFHELDHSWQVFANRHTMQAALPTAKILHYVGYLPWEEQETDVRIENCKIWKRYADCHSL